MSMITSSHALSHHSVSADGGPPYPLARAAVVDSRTSVPTEVRTATRQRGGDRWLAGAATGDGAGARPRRVLACQPSQRRLNIGCFTIGRCA